jgi:hypothetical protein
MVSLDMFLSLIRQPNPPIVEVLKPFHSSKPILPFSSMSTSSPGI